MTNNLFKSESINPRNPKWDNCISRQKDIYSRSDDIRSQFARDYNRLLHCTAFRRLKHKTQVFSATKNDHICTRIEHVMHVNAVSYTIAKFLGLDTELTNAISIGHDIGHAPFGHAGEDFLKKLALEHVQDKFWHEKNSLRFADYCETLEDTNGNYQNLNLTYAVRDGMVCHCGEVDQNGLRPREDFIDLNSISEPAQYSPYTWEGCVVKIADKIAYLGRDIEDALSLKILEREQIRVLLSIIRPYSSAKLREINNTIIMHELITDICSHSNPSNGICLSDKANRLMDELKKFNYSNIYYHKRITAYRDYAELVINSIFTALYDFYDKDKTIESMKKSSDVYPALVKFFSEWLAKFTENDVRLKRRYRNNVLYDLKNKKSYNQAIIDFISGMTDSFAINIFNELTSF